MPGPSQPYFTLIDATLLRLHSCRETGINPIESRERNRSPRMSAVRNVPANRIGVMHERSRVSQSRLENKKTGKIRIAETATRIRARAQPRLLQAVLFGNDLGRAALLAVARAATGRSRVTGKTCCACCRRPRRSGRWQGFFVVGGSGRRLADRHDLDDAPGSGVHFTFLPSAASWHLSMLRTRRSGRLSPLWARSNGRCSGDR